MTEVNNVVKVFEKNVLRKEKIKYRINSEKILFKSTIATIKDSLDVDGKSARIAELKKTQEEDGFFNDMGRVQSVGTELRALEDKIERYTSLTSQFDDVCLLIDLSNEANDISNVDEVVSELDDIEKKANELSLELLLKGKYDANNAILMLHSGAGGTEAQDWTEMLYRMYTRYCERKGYKVTELDKLDGDEAGIKSVSFMASGLNAYGYLKAEMGVHRLVRISPFDSNARRHTSFASLEVMPEIINDDTIKISPDELKIDTYRSSGAGGQHVNKTESAIRITHLPTGIIVQCQNERSQIQNREVAMKMLMGKLIEKREREQLEQAQSIKGELKKIEWGSQIRSYVFQPYTMVKDHRTNYETGNITAVMDGDIDAFITEYLRKS